MRRGKSLVVWAIAEGRQCAEESKPLFSSSKLTIINITINRNVSNFALNLIHFYTILRIIKHYEN
jgi:hypothetical protein